MELSVSRNLVFDDEPLDRILYGSADGREATPADILDRLHGCDDLSLEVLQAVVAILSQDPEKSTALEGGHLASVFAYLEQCNSGKSDHPQEQLKLANIFLAIGRTEQADAVYRQLLESSEGSGVLTMEERRLVRYNLAGLLDQLGRSDEARESRIVGDADKYLADGIWSDLVMVRGMASDFFTAGRFATAENLYRGLLQKRFQQPGTLVHLARVLLMQDRLPEARGAIARAWRLMRDKEVRQSTPFYVLPRIIFFRILFAMLARGNYVLKVKALRRELQGDLSRETWTIAPVIDHFKPYLRNGDVRFLEAIAEAINSAENMDRMNAFEVWTDGVDVFND